MKKYVSLIACLVMMLATMTGCGNSSKNDVRPNDADTNRPGVNDSVVNDGNGMVNDSGIAEPPTSNQPMKDDVKDGIDHAGDAVDRGMDDMGNAVKNATDRMTGK